MRELRQHASRWLARVAAGESFEITDRGRPVATLSPRRPSDWDRMVASGAVIPASGELDDLDPPITGAPMTALLLEDRDEAR